MDYVIRDEETERLLAELAETTGTSVEKALKATAREALDRHRAAEARRAEVDRKVAEDMAWLRSFGPVLPGPSREEIDAEMYDEDGLPR